jgi:hypothetical protein
MDGQAIIISPMLGSGTEDLIWLDAPDEGEQTLRWLQRRAALFSGWVGCLTLKADVTGLPGDIDVWFDDEDLYNPDRELNLSAIAMTGKSIGGNVVICPSMPDGETTGFPAEVAEALATLFQMAASLSFLALTGDDDDDDDE